MLTAAEPAYRASNPIGLRATRGVPDPDGRDATPGS